MRTKHQQRFVKRTTNEKKNPFMFSTYQGYTKHQQRSVKRITNEKQNPFIMFSTYQGYVVSQQAVQGRADAEETVVLKS